MWPFLDYPMYTGPHYAGEAIERQVVVAIRADSTEVVVLPEELGVTFWQFQNILNPAILAGDQGTAESYREIYEDRFDASLIGLRLEDHPLIPTDSGLVEGSPAPLGALSFGSDRGPRDR
jgi:hypothetical protein